MRLSLEALKKRLVTRTTQNLLDLGVLSLAYWAAYFLRFDGRLPIQMWKRLLFTWPYVVAFEVAVLVVFAVPRFSWRHIGLREATRVAWAMATIGASLLAVRLGAGQLQVVWPHAQYALIPIGVIAANAMFAYLGIVGVRALRRIFAERNTAHRLRRDSINPVATLLVGAGQAGAQVARELEKRPDLGVRPVGFLDDEPGTAGTIVHGIRVWGGIDQMAKLAVQLEATQVIVTIADLAPPLLRRILKRCEEAGLPAKVIPGLYQLINEQTGLGRIRDVSIEDLLGREAVQLDGALMGRFLTGKRVMITGAGGSIGSELCRQVARFAPELIVLVERSEFALFSIQQELIRAFPQLAIVPRICDICDESRLDTVFDLDRPQVIFHAAAHKHVPMMEHNPGEAVKNNVFGTKAVADAAHRYECDAFVMISTDKAVNPTSIMGATKRVAEIYIQALSRFSKTKYVAVRFGNVLGSTGSVIPTFKAQIAAGGPVTVTHPEMRRYFMTIPEASQLVMQAAAMGTGGEIFVLDMGEPVKIVDLAHDLIRLSGLVPCVDIQVEFTGMRPGEKLFEELGFDSELMSKTVHPMIWTGNLKPSTLATVEGKLAVLTNCVSSTSTVEVRAALFSMVPEMILADSCEVLATQPTSGHVLRKATASQPQPDCEPLLSAPAN